MPEVYQTKSDKQLDNEPNTPESDDPDEFSRDEDSTPMTKEQLQEESSNSVNSLQRL